MRERANRERLIRGFKALGLDDPEGWAESQLREGIPHLAVQAFLADAWSFIVSQAGSEWIDEHLEYAAERPKEPFAGIGLAIEELVALGASRHCITELVRGAQACLLMDLCVLFDQPGPAGTDSGVQWGLFETEGEDGDGIVARLNCIHESVLMADPTGAEARPTATKPGEDCGTP